MKAPSATTNPRCSLRGMCCSYNLSEETWPEGDLHLRLDQAEVVRRMAATSRSSPYSRMRHHCLKAVQQLEPRGRRCGKA